MSDGIDTRRGDTLLIIIWLAAVAALTLAQLVLDDNRYTEVAYLLAAASAVGAAWVGAARLRGGQRTVGAFLAAGITVSAVADAISIALGWPTGDEPETSVADVGWLSSYVVLGTALFLLLRRGESRHRRSLEGLIDVAAVFVAGMMVVWEFAIAATLADESVSLGTRMVWGAYPVLDVALLALTVRLVMRERTLVSVLLGGGLAVWLAADFSYLLIADAASYSRLLDVGWIWGMVLIALAVLRGPRTRLEFSGEEEATAIDQVGLGRILVALLPLLVPALIELNGFLRGEDTNPLVVLPGTVVLVALAFLRMARLAWSARWARAALVQQEHYASALAANSSDAVVVADEDMRLVDDFPQLAALVGHPGRDIQGTHLLVLVVPEDQEEVRSVVRRSLASPGQVFGTELRVRHGSGRVMWLGARVVNLLADPDVRGVVVNLHDVSDRKRAEEELSHQAFHDSLTGLANRALFRDRLNHALDRNARTGTDPAVIFLDLDGFKSVNDSLGHDAGDDMLKEVAARLSTAIRRGDTVGRLGGDEFAILIEQSARPLDEATAVAERVLQVLRDPVRLGTQTITISASVGIAIGDGLADSASVLRDADVAMYQSKATGKNRWTTYAPGMRTAALERLELETSLHGALERNELRAVYQPVVELESQRVVGFEALMRWQHPEFGLLAPDRFIPIAEETGLIVEMGRWILAEATKTAAGWQERFAVGRKLTMAVNLSARQLSSPELVHDVAHALHASGLQPDSLVLEMTETVLVEDAAATAARLQELHGLGVRLAIDDFGTGYSSLSYLRQFPVDILKIDRSFINTITEQERVPAIVRGLLDLGRTLQLETVAEGVELDFQRSQLQDERCDLAQGFLFARPMPSADAEELLTQLQDSEAARVAGTSG